MLQSLHIENIAVIRTVDIELGNGFTVLTGETGAGKSVMMDALRLLQGAKADKDLIRHGEESAMVSALFADLSPTVAADLAEGGIFPDEEGNIELQRTVTKEGKSTSRINGRAVSLATLKEAAGILFHIHGQDDTGFLKKDGAEFALLDTAVSCEAEKTAYVTLYKELCEVKRQIDKLSFDQGEKERRIETLLYQIDEIEEVDPREGEEDALFEEKMRLKHMERISKQAGFAYRALKGAEKGNVCYVLDRSASALLTLADVIPKAADLAARIEDCLSELEDTAEEIRSLTDLGTEDPGEALDRVQNRMADIARLTRKYGGSVTAVRAYLTKAKAELSALQGADEKRQDLTLLYRSLANQTADAAAALHACRVRAAQTVEQQVSTMLATLDMPSARFYTEFTLRQKGKTYAFDAEGYADAVFYIAVNPGEPSVPLAKTASGGEMSRIMLALQCVIARHNAMPTVIFDEVDSGVSGKTSRKIGLCLKQAAEGAQIISITHSAQIASLGHVHLLVTKQQIQERTETKVQAIEGEVRVAELARILGGIHVTDAQRQAAKDMLTEQDG